MGYREMEPHPALQPFVDKLWVREGGARGESARVLPDGCIDLLLTRNGGGGFVVGAMTRAQPVELRPGAQLVAVRFRPAGAVPYLGVAAHELTDRRVGLAELALGWLPERLLEPPAGRPRGNTPPVLEAVGALERSLLARVPAVPAPDRRVAAAVRALFGQAPPPVERLAGDLGFSRQHLARVFREQVGVGPKLLARIARVHRALGFLQSGREPSLAQAAAAVGYFDEAHMDRDFRDLVGVTPGQAQGSAGSIRPIPSLLGEA